MSVLRIKRLPHGEGLPLPAYQSPLAAGFDILAAVQEDAPVLIAPGERALIPSGLACMLEPGFEAQLRPRSGLALQSGITVLNAPGTIDADYRGEIRVLLINHAHTPFTVTRGMRIAQCVVAPVARIEIVEVAELEETARGAGGFGSTGLR